MTDVVHINSRSYWSQRFAGNWEDRGGRHQSRAFASLALKHMPAWMIFAIRNRRMSVLDWGCALGDGTEILSTSLLTETTGMDFAEEAIAKARETYPSCEFLCWDLASTAIERRWDVVFSSNTLEHFAKPWDMLGKLETIARSALVILVPFREMQRHHEHSYTFLPENVPFTVGDMCLACAKAIDASIEPAAMYNGQQLLLVYVANAFARDLSLSLSDLTWVIDGDAAKERALEQARAEAEVLRAALGRELARSSALDAQRNDLQYRAEGIVRSTSWRVTAPFRIASTLARIAVDTRAHGKRLKWVMQISRERGWRAALQWTYGRLRDGRAGELAAANAAARR